jgi:acetoin utilization deacetylase AcuC-like enzyme
MMQEKESSKDDKSTVNVLIDNRCKAHETGHGHPEQIARFDAVQSGINKVMEKGNHSLKLLKFSSAERKELLRCHEEKYLITAERDIANGLGMLSTGDTNICMQSWNIAKLTAGAAVEGVNAIFRESGGKRSFCGMRPPGHHATADRGMGFCLLNNVAIAARHAQAAHGAEKVLIVDWDVHHGNGTQDIFYEDESVFFFSTHQSPWYPGTGAKNETGSGKGQGTVLNRPFAAGAGRKEIYGAFEKDLLHAANRFKPDLVIISAGFDSRIEDPLGHFQLTDEDFADLTKLMIKIADDHAEGRLLSALEGGYNLDGLKQAVTAHVGALAGIS